MCESGRRSLSQRFSAWRDTHRLSPTPADRPGSSLRDRGLTLPEVLIAVSITTLLVAAMATATQVVLSQNDNTSGRLNNSRSEQSIGIWLPADLASAATVDDSPGASPCGAQCPPGFTLTGTNTLLLTWEGSIPGDTEAIPTLTSVSYRYVLGTDDKYDVIRVQCLSVNGAVPTCEVTTVLHDVLPPPAGSEYVEGATKPVWVMLVTLATDPAAPDDGSPDSGCDPGSDVDPTYYCKNGRRVTVTINGGGDIAGAGGGLDSITLTAGGTNRQPDLGTGALSASPTFAATRSRCGGNFGLLVDTSGSIGGNISYVRSGVNAFIDAFAGTPIKLQVVRFSSTASTLGAGSGWTRYYDMLVESDVTELKGLVNGLSSTGSTNWEDGFFRMFLNSDGTVQTVLPDTLVFFTDGMPTYNRLNATSASAPATMVNDDTDLPTASGSSYNQMSWNRANRLIRQYEADLERLIGVYVGTDVGGSSTWLDLGPGYHLENFLRGYHQAWDRGFHLLNPQRGSHTNYEYAASGISYQYASGLTYQYAASGQTWEYASVGMKFQRKQSGNWRDTDAATYFANNTSTGTGDNYKTVITGALGGWTSINATASTAKSKYDLSNTAAGEADGFRNRVTGTLDSWTTFTSKSLFDITNMTADSSDGYRVVVPGSISSWNTTTKSYYDKNNAVAGSTDGYRASVTGTLGSWTSTTVDYYNLSNTTPTDQNDGYRMSKSYTAPYVDWEVVTDSVYLANNTTADASDGWMATTEYSAPFTYWDPVSQSTYNANNTTTDDTDGWRVSKQYSSPFTAWDTVSEAAYTSGNTSWGNSDGWDATKVYSEPYTFHEGYSSYSRKNTAILKDIVAPGGVVPALKTGSVYTNSKEATYYELPTWDQFAGAMTSMALAECGGTVTLQTKVGSASAADPFTYQSSVDLTTATTSSQYRSGTFDYDLAGGVSTQVTITPMATSVLELYNPAGWSCKSAGVSYPFTTTPVNGGPWTSVTLNVTPNTAISCVQQVTLK